MIGQNTTGMDRFEMQQERTFVERHGHVNEITVGTVLEYDDWQWALVTELAVDRDEPMLGFILLDKVGDHIVQQLETANGCRQHYDVVEHLRDSEHEYWTQVEYVVEDDIWSVLGPVHPEFRSGEDNEKELVTDGGQYTGGSGQFGHANSGYAVEFNLNGICACRTLTMETRAEAETFKHLLESREDTEKVVIRHV